MKKSKLLLTTLASIIAMNLLTACNSGGSGYSNNEVMQAKVKADDEVNSARYNEVASLVAKSITNKIITSGSALITRIEEQSTMKAGDFNRFDRAIYKMYDSSKGDGDIYEKLHNLVDENAMNFNIKENSIAHRNLFAYAINVINNDDASSGGFDNILLKLIDFRSGVCSNLTAYAFSLFKQHKEFKDAKMIPAGIGDHVFLLIKFNDLDTPYVFDAWLPYLDVDTGQAADANKVFFGTLNEYLNKLKDGKKNDYLDPSKIVAADLITQYTKDLNSADINEVNNLWKHQHILDINTDTKAIAAKFEPVK